MLKMKEDSKACRVLRSLPTIKEILLVCLLALITLDCELLEGIVTPEMKLARGRAIVS